MIATGACDATRGFSKASSGAVNDGEVTSVVAALNTLCWREGKRRAENREEDKTRARCRRKNNYWANISAGLQTQTFTKKKVK